MKKLSLNTKFIFVIAIFVITNLTISILGIQKLGSLAESLTHIVQVAVPRVILSKTTDALTSDLLNEEKTFILEENAEGMAKIGVKIDDIEKDLFHKIDELNKIETDEG